MDFQREIDELWGKFEEMEDLVAWCQRNVNYRVSQLEANGVRDLDVVRPVSQAADNCHRLMKSAVENINFSLAHIRENVSHTGRIWDKIYNYSDNINLMYDKFADLFGYLIEQVTRLSVQDATTAVENLDVLEELGIPYDHDLHFTLVDNLERAVRKIHNAPEKLADETLRLDEFWVLVFTIQFYNKTARRAFFSRSIRPGHLTNLEAWIGEELEQRLPPGLAIPAPLAPQVVVAPRVEEEATDELWVTALDESDGAFVTAEGSVLYVPEEVDFNRVLEQEIEEFEAERLGRIPSVSNSYIPEDSLEVIYRPHLDGSSSIEPDSLELINRDELRGSYIEPDSLELINRNELRGSYIEPDSLELINGDELDRGLYIDPDSLELINGDELGGSYIESDSLELINGYERSLEEDIVVPEEGGRFFGETSAERRELEEVYAGEQTIRSDDDIYANVPSVREIDDTVEGVGESFIIEESDEEDVQDERMPFTSMRWANQPGDAMVRELRRSVHEAGTVPEDVQGLFLGTLLTGVDRPARQSPTPQAGRARRRRRQRRTPSRERQRVLRV